MWRYGARLLLIVCALLVAESQGHAQNVLGPTRDSSSDPVPGRPR